MIRLTHLTLVGTDVEPASVGFGSELSVVHGPSDTGKSFIVDAIDFALGSKALKAVKGVEGYTHVLLGLMASLGEQYTLARPIKGGRFSLYKSDMRFMPTEPPETTLATKHNSTTEDNVSRFLLRLTGFDGRMLKRNARNETDALSFRNLAHFVVVDETQMQSELPPVYTGISPTTRTKELSVLKLLLEGEDDADLVAIAASPQQKRAKAAKSQVVEALIDSINLKLKDVAEEADLREQLARLNSRHLVLASALRQAAEARVGAVDVVSALEADVRTIRANYINTRALSARLSLLEAQYASDLSRLGMIKEAGSLLGFFATGVCPFCGTDTTDSPAHAIAHNETVPFSEAVAVEVEKTVRLRNDLMQTLSDLEMEQGSLRQEHLLNVAVLRERQGQLSALDADQAPMLVELQKLEEQHRELDRVLGLHDQRAAYVALLADIQAETSAETGVQAKAVGMLAVDAFSSHVSAVLGQWGYPEAGTARYDRSDNDIVADGQLRAGHGKGVRAVLHAAFSIALAQYCVSRGLPHPGFIVLDSPLVTYKPPKPGQEDLRSEAFNLPSDFTTRFYASLDDLASDVQVIVMENVDPPAGQEGGLTEIEFSKSPSSHTRYGFFPHTPSAPPA